VFVAIRDCQVSFSDPRGVRHRVTVQDVLDTDDGFGDVTVEVSTTTVHTVPLHKPREWRDANSGSPREMARKANARR
jgi:hypothetical protein